MAATVPFGVAFFWRRHEYTATRLLVEGIHDGAFMKIDLKTSVVVQNIWD